MKLWNTLELISVIVYVSFFLSRFKPKNTDILNFKFNQTLVKNVCN